MKCTRNSRNLLKKLFLGGILTVLVGFFILSSNTNITTQCTSLLKRNSPQIGLTDNEFVADFMKLYNNVSARNARNDLIGDNSLRNIDPNHHFIPYMDKDWVGKAHPFYMFLYSAIYDDRPIFGRPTIVVLGITEPLEFDKHTIKCIMYIHGKKQGLLSKAGFIFNTMASVFDSKGKQKATFMITCPTPINISEDKLRAVALQVTLNKTAEKLWYGLRTIEFPSKPPEKEDLAICVCTMYKPTYNILKNIDSALLVEWFEMQMMMGVQHFTIYIHSISFDTYRVLKYYVDKGVLTLLSMGPVDSDMYKLPRFTSLADCMYRHMYTHKKVMVIDTDEILIPKEDITYMPMLHSLAKIYNASFENTHFEFQNHYYFMDHKMEDQTKPFYTRFFKYRHASPPTPFKGPMKSIQDPYICRFATNHRCIVTTRNAKTLWIDASYVSSHHYKDCYTSREQYNCTLMLSQIKPDDIMLRYEERIMPKITQIVKQLGFWSYN